MVSWLQSNKLGWKKNNIENLLKRSILGPAIATLLWIWNMNKPVSWNINNLCGVYTRMYGPAITTLWVKLWTCIRDVGRYCCLGQAPMIAQIAVQTVLQTPLPSFLWVIPRVNKRFFTCVKSRNQNGKRAKVKANAIPGKFPRLN